MLTPPKSTKDKLMRAALTIVARDGLGAATTAAIAEQAGVAEGTLYRHFSSKDDLLISTYRRLKADIFEKLAEDYDTDAGVEQRFRHVWRRLFDSYRADLQAFQFGLRFAESALSEKEGGMAGEAIVGLIGELHQDGVAAHGVKNLPFDLMMSLFYAPLQALLKREVTGRKWSKKELDAAVTAAWDSWRV